MRKIKIYSDTEKGCLFFDGSSVNPKFIGTIVATEHPTLSNRVIVKRTDRFQEDGVSFRILFGKLNIERVQDRDGNDLVATLGMDRAAVVDYINEQANDYQDTTSTRPPLTAHPDFTLDATSTTIMVDNGESFGVNTLKAVLGADGLVDIVSSDHSNNSITYYEDCPAENLKVNGAFPAGGPQDVVNALNELFTVGAFESVVVSDPHSTLIADVGGASSAWIRVGSNSIDPDGSDVGGRDGGGINSGGVRSTVLIDQPGEYFSFDLRRKDTYGLGLIDVNETSGIGAEDKFCDGTGNYAEGFKWSQWLHSSHGYAWTMYGSDARFSYGPAWVGSNDDKFHTNEEHATLLADGNVKFRVGIDANSFIHCDYYDVSESRWVRFSRSSYAVTEGSQFALGIKFGGLNGRLASDPLAHLLEPAAPVMNFRWIESPDGTYQWPLFATAEEANYYDANHTFGSPGSGTSHAHVFPDDPTSTTWYMPDTGSTMTDTSDPVGVSFAGQAVAWTEITSLANADLTPPAFADTTITVDELSMVNYQLSPVDVGYVTTIGGIPSWSVVGNALVGVAPEVSGDNVANPSDTTTVTVYRTNSYGTSSGTLTINITNLTAPPVTPIAGVTLEGGTALVDSDTMGDGSVISIDDVVEAGNRVVLNKEWLDNVVLPAITSGSGSKSVWIGFAAQGVTPDYTAISNADFRVAYEFNCDDASRAANNWRLKTHIQGTSLANVGVGSLTSGLYDYVFLNEGTHVRTGALVASQGHNASTKVFDPNDGDWNWTLFNTSDGASQDLIIATVNTTLDIDLSEFSEVAEPAPPVSNLTSWNKALDFSGSSERAQQVNSSAFYNPLMMSSLANTTTIASSGNTVNHSNGRPWATAIVFRADGHNSNQHIWNHGEGSGGDNIYLRLSASRQLFFGWGRDGSLNELYIGTITANRYYGVYVGHNGTRTTGASATNINLSQWFDVRLMSAADDFASISDQGTAAEWGNTGFSTVGGRLDRSVNGNFTIGGRGANRSFHGKIASMVVTTLKLNSAMPDDTEIEMMITDPVRWVDDYKVGNDYRVADGTQNFSNFQRVTHGNGTYTAGATQVWLMGDGSNDSYSNMIRNHIQPADQNATKLNMISMVSNDIQTVNVPGLTS